MIGAKEVNGSMRNNWTTSRVSPEGESKIYLNIKLFVYLCLIVFNRLVLCFIYLRFLYKQIIGSEGQSRGTLQESQSANIGLKKAAEMLRLTTVKAKRPLLWLKLEESLRVIHSIHIH